MLQQPPKIHWKNNALFIDVDGTLLEIEERPEIVCADHALIEILQDVGRVLGGAVALVSGRPILDIDRVFSGTQFVIVGAHGMEIRCVDGAATNESADLLPDALVDKANQFIGKHDGLLLEKKEHGIALHYRQAPELEDSCRRFMCELMDEYGDAFRLLEGKMVFEMTPLRYNKGTGICRVLQAPPFRGRVPVYVGDDVTDEDAFRVVNERSGISIRVGQARETDAHFALNSVSAVHAWLRGIVSQGASE